MINVLSPSSNSSQQRVNRYVTIAIFVGEVSIILYSSHSAEILSVPQAESNGSCTNKSDAKPTPTRNSDGRSHKSGTSKVTAVIPSLPATYVALYPYKPQKSDELELKKGCKF